ncbi:putative nuclease HARBI1 [Episyrphus balteatus]|uniref:putative nuclease HARBI1 n=1 Tax=Episyrphus balteatus TaxID=286459 RepID=UPI00248690B3|nr:putative nuclease HARBI1 [Episyrphus balteatus]
MDSGTAKKLKLALALATVAYIGLNAYNLHLEEEESKEKKKKRQETLKRKYEQARANSSSSEDEVNYQPRRRLSFQRQVKIEQQSNDELTPPGVDMNEDLKVSHVENFNEKRRESDFVDLVSKYSDEMFKDVFHVSRNTAERLYIQFKSSPEYDNIFKLNDQTRIPAKHYIWMFLWFVGRKGTYLELSSMFNVSLSKAVSVVDTVLQFLNNSAREFIQFPESNTDMRNSADSFEQIADFPDVIACLLNTRIQTKGTKTPFWIQVLCDSKGRFLDVFIESTSDLHPTAVLENSPINEKIKNICQRRYHILAKQDYFVREWLLTPIDEPTSKEQIWYNRQHSKTMNVVLDSLEILIQRFPQLTAMQFFSSYKIKRMINACCILQNICLEEEDFFDAEVDPMMVALAGAKNDEGQTKQRPEDIECHLRKIGELKRKQIYIELKKEERT